LLSLLRQDQQEIHDADEKDHGHQQESQTTALAAGLEQVGTQLALHHDHGFHRLPAPQRTHLRKRSWGRLIVTADDYRLGLQHTALLMPE
jgi:hypothetical protein